MRLVENTKAMKKAFLIVGALIAWSIYLPFLHLRQTKSGPPGRGSPEKNNHYICLERKGC